MFDHPRQAVKGGPIRVSWHRAGWGMRLFLVFAALAVSACSTRGGPVPYDVQNFNPPDAPKPIDVSQDYHVAAQDVVTVSVYNVPEFSGDFTVDNLGRLHMPLLGAVAVQGLTSDEIAAEITKQLGSTYVQNPKVQIAVKELAGRRITVDGSVSQPGVYPIAGDISLIQSIAMARGTTDDANPRRVVVFRTINGQRMAAAFDLTDIRRGLKPDPIIYQNDIIVVDGSKTRKIFRDSLTTIPLLGLFARF